MDWHLSQGAFLPHVWCSQVRLWIHCHLDQDEAVIEELISLHFLTKEPSDVQKNQYRSNNALQKERSLLPDTSTVMVTWLPSMTLRSRSSFRKTGAEGLFCSKTGTATGLLIFDLAGTTTQAEN